MRSKFFGIRIAIVALATYWVVLSVATHLPKTVLRLVQRTTNWNDKLLHATAFTVLAFLLAWAIPTDPKRRSRNVVIAAAIGVAYAAIDELTQIPVGRTADWADFSADLFGILTGVIVYVVMREALFPPPSRLQP